MIMVRCLLPLLLAACAPSLNWRDVTEQSLSLQLQFPCKPQRVVSPDMGLLQCEADGQRFILGWRTWQEPLQARADLADAAASLARRMEARAEVVASAALPAGATAWPGTGRFLLRGGKSAGAVQLWAQGTTVVRALVLGNAAAAEDVFFDSVRRVG
jgi:hypothetical protein